MKRIVKTRWMYFHFKEDHSSDESTNKQWSKGIWSRQHWSINRESLESKLAKLSDYCDEHQVEIKAVMPLTRAQSYDYGQSYWDTYNSASNGVAMGGWGLGYGWGVGMVDGYAVMLQQIEEVTDDEYVRRKKVKTLSGQLAQMASQVTVAENAWKEACTRLHSAHEELEILGRRLADLDWRRTQIEARVHEVPAYDVLEKRKLFKKIYEVAGQTYASADEAQKAIADKQVRARQDFETQKARDLQELQAEEDRVPKLQAALVTLTAEVSVTEAALAQVKAELSSVQTQIEALSLPIDEFFVIG